MKVLVINAGSSSLKYQLIDMADESILAKGIVECIGQKDAGNFVYQGKGNIEVSGDIPNHIVAFQKVVTALTDKEYGVISSLSELGAVGHRVLHSGMDFNKSAIMDAKNLAICKTNEDLGPLHMPANIGCIEAAQKVLPNTPMVAVFDTVFHMTMPEFAYRYALPKEYLTDLRIRKYGFHGTSHQYVSGEARKYLRADESARIITCHLGNGSSLSAVKDGKCIDTSMGLTPLEGVIMGTRSGDLDPAVIGFVAQKTGMNAEEVIEVLNKKSGLKAICGESDFRRIEALYNKGDKDAILASQMFAYRIRKYIGSYYVALGGLDALVLTGGIGENSYFGRKLFLEGLECLGIKVNDAKNKAGKQGAVCEIQANDSKVKILILPTNEELVIAREAKALVEGK